MLSKFVFRMFVAVFFLGASTGAAWAQVTIQTDQGEVTVSLQTYADQIQSEVGRIRGLPFKASIKANNQSLDDFETYIDAELRSQLPGDRAKNYGKVVKKVGLHRGKEIEDLIEMTKVVMKSQAAAYYDPETSAFYVLMNDMPEVMLGGIYAHELYHGLQDQHYDLDRYLMALMRKGANDDEIMARQAVVEGEATYIMTLWSMQHITGLPPEREMVEFAINFQAGMDSESMREMIQSGPVQSMLAEAEGMQRAVDALDHIPSFMIETMVGAYMKGMQFVFEIQRNGWGSVEQLYAMPPVSSEQILHPEKWMTSEMPYVLEWSDFEAEPALQNWKLLDANTLGEIQIGIIFREHGFRDISLVAADGWDGDRYAVLEHEESGELMLLLYTCWDNEDEALEFSRVYEPLQEEKYRDEDVSVVVHVEGKDVLVIEAPEGADTGALLAVMHRTKKARMVQPEIDISQPPESKIRVQTD